MLHDSPGVIMVWYVVLQLQKQHLKDKGSESGPITQKQCALASQLLYLSLFTSLSTLHIL